MSRFWIMAVTGVLAATSVLAQEVNQEFVLGQEKYLAACAACHGESAYGSGEIATMFKDGVRISGESQNAMTAAFLCSR